MKIIGFFAVVAAMVYLGFISVQEQQAKIIESKRMNCERLYLDIENDYHAHSFDIVCPNYFGKDEPRTDYLGYDS